MTLTDSKIKSGFKSKETNKYSPIKDQLHPVNLAAKWEKTQEFSGKKVVSHTSSRSNNKPFAKP